MGALTYLYLFILLMILPICDFYKILVVSPLPVRSHVLLGRAYVDTLLEAGHEVTYIAVMSRNISHPNLHVIDVTRRNTYMSVKRKKREEIILERHEQKYFAHVIKYLILSTLQHKNVYKLLQNTTQRFDLVISEWTYSDAFSGFAVLYNCPLIWYSSMKIHWTILRRIEEARNPASISDSVHTSQNVPPFASAFVLQNMYLYNLEKEIFKTTFEPLMTARGKVLCSYEETRHFNSLVLVNSLLLLNEDTTLPEKFKPITGLHIGRKMKPLPKELKNILDNARKGVIYFSMGTVLKSQYVPVTLKLIDVFRKLKQIVIWNTEAKFPNLPSNVHTLKWAPQQSILSHPNCILFITHGGLFSLTEAVNFGVPIIGIPAFGDQFTHVENAVRKGFAIYVDLSHSMSKDVYDAILTILSNPRYRKEAKEQSFIYNVRRLPPRVELNNWVKYAIRTGVSIPIRSPTTNVPLYKKMYLDLAIIIFIILAFSKFIIMRSLSALCSSKQKNE